MRNGKKSFCGATVYSACILLLFVLNACGPDPAALRMKAHELETLGKIEEAKMVYRILIEKYPGSIHEDHAKKRLDAFDAQNQLRRMVDKLDELILAGNDEDAYLLYQNIPKESLPDDLFWKTREHESIFAFFRAKDFERAGDENNALQTYLRVAQTYRGSKYYKSAVKSFNNIRVRQILREANKLIGVDQEAMMLHYKVILEDFPDHPVAAEVNRRIERMRAGEILKEGLHLSEEEEYEEASERLKELLETFPDTPQARVAKESKKVFDREAKCRKIRDRTGSLIDMKVYDEVVGIVEKGRAECSRSEYWKEIEKNLQGAKAKAAGEKNAKQTPVWISHHKAVVRSGPGKDFDITGVANWGTRLGMFDDVPSWYKIFLPSGDKGWVLKRKVWFKEPTETDRLVDKGLGEIESENYLKAIFVLQRALPDEPDNGRLHFALGIAYAGLAGRDSNYLERGEQELDKAIDLSANNPRFFFVRGAFRLSNSFNGTIGKEERDQYREYGMADIDKAVELSPPDDSLAPCAKDHKSRVEKFAKVRGEPQQGEYLFTSGQFTEAIQCADIF